MYRIHVHRVIVIISVFFPHKLLIQVQIKYTLYRYSVLEGQTRYVMVQLVEAVRYTRKVAGSVDIFH